MAGFQSQRRGGGLIRRLAVLVVGLVLVWLAGLVRFADSIPHSIEAPERRSDAIVVLTGGSGRLNEGLDLLEKDLGERLFVSGVYQGVDVKTLFQMFQHDPQELEARISIGTAINTMGNATETAAWIATREYKSLRLVTASYHMPRSLLEFHHAMPETIIIAHPVFPEHVKVDRWWLWPGTMGLIASEYNKFMYAWLRQGTEKQLVGKAAN
ncbi:MAG: YdcF family protein [Rhodospirillales bacterium]|nr:YdcF family protein [Rhodospirillales bacterium]